MTFRTIIADDERPARERLRYLLEGRPGYSIVAEAESGLGLAELVERHRPDLLFLDVQMPGSSGLDALKSIEPVARPVVIFATAHNQYALDAFEASAIGYLLKPFTDERFDAALRRATQLIVGKNRELWEGELRSLLSERTGQSRYLDRFAVTQPDRVLLVPATEVDWIEAAGDYVKLHRGPERFLIRTTMQALEECLDPAVFLRVHRSHFVRLDRIVAIEPYFNGEAVLVLRDRTAVQVGRTYREVVRARLGVCRGSG